MSGKMNKVDGYLFLNTIANSSVFCQSKCLTTGFKSTLNTRFCPKALAREQCLNQERVQLFGDLSKSHSPFTYHIYSNYHWSDPEEALPLPFCKIHSSTALREHFKSRPSTFSSVLAASAQNPSPQFGSLYSFFSQLIFMFLCYILTTLLKPKFLLCFLLSFMSFSKFT